MTQTKKDSTPVLMYVDEAGIDAVLSGHRTLLDSLNAILIILKQKGIVFEELAEVKEMSTTTDLPFLLKSKQVKKADFQMGGLKLNNQQVASLVELPDLGQVPALLNSLQTKARFDPRIPQFVESNYVLNEEGTVEMAPGREARIREEHSTYSNTEKQARLFKKMQAIADQYNEVVTEYKFIDKNFGLTTPIEQMLRFNGIEGRYNPNVNIILNRF